MSAAFSFVIDLAMLAQGLGVTQADARAVLSDARIATPILRRAFAARRPGWRVQPGVGGADQLRGPDGARWLVKTISDPTDFRPSAQIGKGRTTDPAGVRVHWRGLGGYLLLDVSGLPKVSVYRVPATQLEGWREAGLMSAGYRVRRATLMGRLVDGAGR